MKVAAILEHIVSQYWKDERCLTGRNDDVRLARKIVTGDDVTLITCL